MVPGICIADWYSNGGLNNGLLIKWRSEYYTTIGHLISKPFDDQINPHDLNTKVVIYLDLHCISIVECTTLGFTAFLVYGLFVQFQSNFLAIT